MEDGTRRSEGGSAPGSEIHALGGRLRALRKSNGLSLEALARRAGVAVGTLSQVEREVSQPSLRTLQKVAGALGVPTAFFFEAPPEEGEVDGVVVRAGAGAELKVSGMGIAKTLLTPRRMEGLQLMLVRIQPHSSSGAAAYGHPGLDAGYVVAGSLNLEVEGRVYVLGVGDSFGFDSGRPHRFENRGAGEAVVLWINTQRTLASLGPDPETE